MLVKPESTVDSALTRKANKMLYEEPLTYLARYGVKIVVMVGYGDYIKLRKTTDLEKQFVDADVVVEIPDDIIKMGDNITEIFLFNELQRIDVKLSNTDINIRIEHPVVAFTRATISKYKDTAYIKELFGGVKKHEKPKARYGEDFYGQIWDTTDYVRKGDDRSR